ncbi:MAG: VTT domain-containing protein [Dehalococcoidia bacterium]|nr:VTT domain-containing protein [Dehalococcoidia bacterium]
MKEQYVRRKGVQIVVFVLVLGLSLAIFWFARSQLNADGVLAQSYAGIFTANLITSATILFPLPGEAVNVAAGSILSPLNVAMAAAVGATIGEMTAYLAGLWGKSMFLTGYSARYEHAQGWMNRHGVLAVFLFALIPMLLYDLIGIFAGSTRYNLLKFVSATFAGRFLRCLIEAWLGYSAITLLQLPW